MAMIRSHAASASPALFRLLYSVRRPEDRFFADELDASADPTVGITYIYTRETPAEWPVAAGRITKDALAAATIPASEKPTVFVCGPNGFVESVADWLVQLGHDPGSVKTERFGGK